MITVICITSTIPKIHGFLSLFMVEIVTGVFVGHINTKVRTNIWNIINKNIVDGTATMCYTHNGKILIKKTGQNRRRQIKDLELCLVGFEKLPEDD